MPTIYCYVRCSTCTKALRWLDEHQVDYITKEITQTPPAAVHFEAWFETQGRSYKSFFNTSGQKYRALKLKEKLPEMVASQCAELLASDGMLIKRPLLVGDDGVVLSGFSEKSTQNTLI